MNEPDYDAMEASELAATALEEMRVRAEAAEAERDRARDQITEWESASGLITSAGDPDGVMPAQAQKYWEDIEAEYRTVDAENIGLRTLNTHLLAKTKAFGELADAKEAAEAKLAKSEAEIKCLRAAMRRFFAIGWPWIDIDTNNGLAFNAQALRECLSDEGIEIANAGDPCSPAERANIRALIGFARKP